MLYQDALDQVRPNYLTIQIVLSTFLNYINHYFFLRLLAEPFATGPLKAIV